MYGEFSVRTFGAVGDGLADDSAAIQAAFNAAIASSGPVVIPPGNYRTTKTVTADLAGATVTVCSVPGAKISYFGAGDCLQIFDSSAYNPRPWGRRGVTGGLVIDGTHTSTTSPSAGLHIGDIPRLAIDVTVTNWHNSPGSIGVWFDNQHYWTEQIHGRVEAQSCGTAVQFDNSANLTGQATNSFERMILDVFLSSNGVGDGVTFANGALTIDHRLGIYGNMSSGAAQYAALRLTGSSATGGSRIDQGGVLNMGVELGDTTRIAPYTIFFAAGGNRIYQNRGVLDFSGHLAFTPANTAAQFTFAGTVLGDPVLAAVATT